MNNEKYYDCPKCGKSNSSPDGEIYCPPCEVEYQRELEQDDTLTDANFIRWVRDINI